MSIEADISSPAAQAQLAALAANLAGQEEKKPVVRGGGGGGQHGIPGFISKLWSMLNNPKNAHLICWSDSGNTFLVMDSKRLAAEILPNYYKSNFNSFVRQLNMYGFHKVLNAERKQAAEERGNQEPEQWEFVHPWVQRGRQENLIHVKRKAEGDRGRKRPPPEEMTAVMSEMNMLKQHNMELASRLQIVEKQNQALWDGLHDERKRAATQQKKIEKIMVFLSAHFQGHGHEVEAGGAKRDALETGASPGAVSMRKRAKLQPADGAEDGDSEVANAAAQAAAAAFPTFMKMPSASGGAGGGGGGGSSSGGSAPTLSHIDVLAGIFNPSPASSTPSPQSEQVNEAVGGVLQNFESRINLTKARLSDHMDDDLLAGIFHLPDTPQGGSNGGGGGVATAAAAGGGGGGGSIQSGSASAAAMAAPARRGSMLNGHESEKGLMFTPLSDLIDLSADI